MILQIPEQLNIMSQIDILAAQQNRLFLGSFFLNLMFVKIVLLGKLHVLQKLWITSLHAHVPLDRGFPQPVTMILSALVVSGVVLLLAIFCQDFISCRSESSKY